MMLSVRAGAEGENSGALGLMIAAPAPEMSDTV